MTKLATPYSADEIASMYISRPDGLVVGYYLVDPLTGEYAPRMPYKTFMEAVEGRTTVESLRYFKPILGPVFTQNGKVVKVS